MTDIATTDPYDVFNTESSTGPLEIPAGTSLLVTAPDSVGQEFIEGRLGEGIGDSDRRLVITTDDAAGTVVDRVAAAAGAEPSTIADSLHVIDCQTDQLNPDTDDSVVTQNVDTPRNLTDIGIGFKDAFNEFERTDAERIRVGVLSLSVILTYVDPETVYRFCQTLTRAVQHDNAIGFFLLTATAHDEETINTLRRALDGAVEIRDDDGPAARVVGLDTVPSDWHRFGQ